MTFVLIEKTCAAKGEWLSPRYISRAKGLVKSRLIELFNAQQESKVVSGIFKVLAEGLTDWLSKGIKQPLFMSACRDSWPKTTMNWSVNVVFKLATIDIIHLKYRHIMSSYPK